MTFTLEVLENLQEIIWGKIEGKVKEFIKKLIEELLEEESKGKIGACRYERTEARRGYRNGHYERDLITRFGLVEDIRVPRTDSGGMEFEVIGRYEQRRRDVDAAIGLMFLNGVSTRKIRGIARAIYGKEVSPQTVSNTLSYLDEELSRYRDKPIDDTVEFLFVDGIHTKVREIGIEGKVMLCALGIFRDVVEGRVRKREILSFRLADVEDEASWRGFLADLKGRGLLGKHLKLIISDRNPGLLKALRGIYPFVKVQTCIAHRMRNVAVKIRKVNRTHCLGEAKLIFGADNKREAIKRFKAWEKKWVVEEERAVRCMRKDFFIIFTTKWMS